MMPQISQSAAMRRDDICLYVSPANRTRLEGLIASRNTPSKVVWRAKIVLATADGCGTNEIMRRTGKSKPCVWRWQERYIEAGVDGLMRDKTRPSRVPPLPDKVKLAVLKKSANETPANATHWSRASMAAQMGISPSSVGRIWAEAGLKPHLVRRFKVSDDPQFEEKLTDVVGLYLNPPDQALVLCVDEKSQIQALDRTQPGLPLKKGRAATMTHDYKRNGTTTLFAALDVRSGLVIGQCQPRHLPRNSFASSSSSTATPTSIRPSSDRRQLRDAQDTQGEGLARQASPFPPALHADLRLLAQPGRAVLCRDHHQAHPARNIQQRHRTQTRHS